MEPNYKNFVNWKQSQKGKEFLMNKDKEEIEQLQKNCKWIEGI